MHEWHSTKYPGADQGAQQEPQPKAAPNGQDDPGRQGPGGRPKGDARYTGLATLQAFMADMRPPEYLVDGVFQRGCTYSMTGLTGSGKTAITLLMATCVATGQPFCGRETAQGSVVFLAGENPDNVRWQIYALRADLGLECTSLPIHLHDGNFSIEAAFERLAKDATNIPNLSLVVPDTHQAFFQGDNDSDNVQMIQAARDFRALTGLPGRPTVVIPCHPIKYPRKDNMVPRGGSAFLNEVDGNVAAWCDDDVVELYRHGKHRGVPYDPLRFRLVRTEPEGLLDSKGRQMPCTVARPLLTVEAEHAARETENRENRVLDDFIQRNPTASMQAIADALGVHRTSAGRLVGKLKVRKWIKEHGRTLILTAEGKAVLGG